MPSSKNNKNLTEFGKMFRIIRIKHNSCLSDASAFLGVSGSYITAVERGEKTAPYYWIGKVIKYYKLNDAEAKELRESYYKSPKTEMIRVSMLRTVLENLVMNTRGVDKLDSEDLKFIDKMIDDITNETGGKKK